MELPAGQDGVPTGQDGLAHRTIWTGKQDKMDLLTGLLEQYGLARRTRWTGPQDKIDLPTGRDGVARRTRWSAHRTRWTCPQDNMDWQAGQDGLAHRTVGTIWTGPQDRFWNSASTSLLLSRRWRWYNILNKTALLF